VDEFRKKVLGGAGSMGDSGQSTVVNERGVGERPKVISTLLVRIEKKNARGDRKKDHRNSRAEGRKPYQDLN